MPHSHHSTICQTNVFDKIYREQARVVYTYIYFQTKNKELAEDILQEAFLKLWENCAKVELDRVKPYLFKVARNIYLNKVERSKVAQKYMHQLQRHPEKESPLFLLEQQEFKQQLENAINKLTPAQKEVFLLNRIEKLKYREIAELLNISQKAVEKRMHKALLELRKLYDKI